MQAATLLRLFVEPRRDINESSSPSHSGPSPLPNLGLPLPASYGPESCVGHEAKTAIHGEAQVGPEGHMANWKRQKGHQQEVGCVPRQNSRKRLHEIGRESFCHGISRLLAVRLKPQYPRILQSATAISGQKPTADLMLIFVSIRCCSMLGHWAAPKRMTRPLFMRPSNAKFSVGSWDGPALDNLGRIGKYELTKSPPTTVDCQSACLHSASA